VEKVESVPGRIEKKKRVYPRGGKKKEKENRFSSK
jgi:hypothetical protein